eukprot:4656990-Pleurochrysis_carterae.AAC.1
MRCVCSEREDRVLLLANVKHFGANSGEYAAFSRLFCQAFADVLCQTAGVMLSVAIKTLSCHWMLPVYA